MKNARSVSYLKENCEGGLKMTVVLGGAFTPVICIVLVMLALLAVAVLFYLIPEIMRYSKVSELNSRSIRDRRFAFELLSVYFKKNVIENPYLLRTDKDCRPDADLVVVCEGGIIVLTVEYREGYFETPKNGDWTYRFENEVQRIPNPFERGMYYANACSNIAKRNGISCPVFNLVLLSNDEVEYNDASGDGVLTNDMLVPCVRSIKSRQKISASETVRLTELIKQNDRSCRKLFGVEFFDDYLEDDGEAGSSIADIFRNGIYRQENDRSKDKDGESDI